MLHKEREREVEREVTLVTLGRERRERDGSRAEQREGGQGSPTDRTNGAAATAPVRGPGELYFPREEGREGGRRVAFISAPK